YAMTGGVPSYLIRFAGKGPLKEKITAGFLNPQGFFFEEPGKLLKQELREMGNYNALLRGIATGAERISGLAYKTGLETGLISHLLKVLLKMGIVERETPVYETDQAGKKPVYAITDNLFAFWYRFIPPLLELIQRRNSEKAWEYLKDEFGLYMENVFGEVCLQYLVRENAAGKLPFFFQKAGRLWGSDPRAGSSGKELIALRDKTHGLFCGCLWKNEGKDADVLNSLIARAGEFRFARTWFMLFSKNPFSGSCKKLAARRKDVVLLTFKEMRSC
ncbi:MAG: hypothetical protein LBT16_08965, partial [Treponema sp.]|nr:hypothetical protein [Treponema sp.]